MDIYFWPTVAEEKAVYPRTGFAIIFLKTKNYVNFGFFPITHIFDPIEKSCLNHLSDKLIIFSRLHYYLRKK